MKKRHLLIPLIVCLLTSCTDQDILTPIEVSLEESKINFVEYEKKF